MIPGMSRLSRFVAVNRGTEKSMIPGMSRLSRLSRQKKSKST
jgi:hypothetical protein